MKKIIDLIACSGSHKDEKLLNYIRNNYLKKNYLTKICFIYGQGRDWNDHKQLSADELRKLMFETNDKNTIYFLASFFFNKDRTAYLKLMEDACNNDIQIFKTDQLKSHLTEDKEWTNKYCHFITIEDINTHEIEYKN